MRAFSSCRFGVSSLEYGILASVLGVVLVAIFHGFGHKLTTLFSVVGHSI